MAWNELPSKAPATVGSIALTFTDNDNVPANHIATYVIQVLDAEGNVFSVETGDLVPHLAPEEKTAFIDFLAGIRTKTETAFLP